MSTTSPVSSMIPVNISSDNDVRSVILDRPVLQRNRIGKSVDARAADCRNLAAAKDFRGQNDNYFINDSGAEGAEGQVGAAFHEETLDFHGVKRGREFGQIAAEQQRAGEL